MFTEKSENWRDYYANPPAPKTTKVRFPLKLSLIYFFFLEDILLSA